MGLLSFAAFLPGLRGDFVSWDDAANFLGNPHYRGLSWRQLEWMWSTFQLGHYVPLTWMTHGLDYLLWGMNPAGYHLVSLLLHTANAILLYFIGRRVLWLVRGDATADKRALAVPAAFATLLYAVHPLRVESVVWITERRDVLSMLFYLLSITFYLNSAENRERFVRWYALAILAFVCALLSKATVVTLPAVLVVLNVYPLHRLGGTAGWWSPSSRRVYLELAPFAVLSVATAMLSLIALQQITPLTVAGKVAVSAYSLSFYVWKTLVPWNLAPLYEMKPVNPAAPMFIAGYVAVAIMAVGVWAARRRQPSVTAAFVAFVLVVFPLLGVIQNGPQIAADRYTYHASPALALLGSTLLLSEGRRLLRVSVASAVLVVLCALTWKQSSVWKDSRSLWAQALRVDPQSSIANNDYGVELAKEGKTGEAVAHYRRALDLRPQYADPHNNLGFELDAAGRSEEALGYFERALLIKPDYLDAAINLGNALVKLDRFDEGIEQYRAVIQTRPDHARAYVNWGVALARQGKFAEAGRRFHRALEIDPSLDDARAYLERATIEIQRGTGARAHP